MVLQVKGARRRVSYAFERAGVPAAPCQHSHHPVRPWARGSCERFQADLRDRTDSGAARAVARRRAGYAAGRRDGHRGCRGHGRTAPVWSIRRAARRHDGDDGTGGRERPVSTRVRDGWVPGPSIAMRRRRRHRCDGLIGRFRFTAHRGEVERNRQNRVGRDRNGSHRRRVTGTDVSTTSLVEVSKRFAGPRVSSTCQTAIGRRSRSATAASIWKSPTPW